MLKHLSDLDVYRHWLTQSLASYPDPSISGNTDLILDGYDVVDKMEYPPEERLVAGAVDAYDTVMLTGSRELATNVLSEIGLG